MTIEIYFNNNWKSKPYLHNDLETNTYFMVLNSKKNNRNLKRLIAKVKKKFDGKEKINFVVNNKFKYLNEEK